MYALKHLTIFIFVSYICLVRKNWTEEALEFWNENIKQPPDLTLFYEQELLELAQLTNAEQLTDTEFLGQNPFVASAAKSKFVVKLSRFAYNLIKAFVVDNELLYVSTVLNEKVQFQLYDSPPDGRAPCGGSSSSDMSPSLTLPGFHSAAYELNAKSKSGNSQLPTIQFAVPGKAPLHIPTLSDIPALTGLGEDLLLNELLMKVVRPRLLLSNKRVRPSDSTITAASDSGKSVTEKVYIRNQWMRPEQCSLIAGDALQPSILFATMSNTYNGMICMDINEDATQVVAGFQNHSVCIFGLTNQSASDTHSSTQGRGAASSGSVKVPRKDKDTNVRHPFLHRQAVNHSLSDVFPKPKPQFEAAIHGLADGIKSSASAASGASDFEVHDGGDQFIEFFGHSRPVYGVSQNASGKMVLSASADETVRLWDVNLRQTVAKYNLQSVVWDVKFNQTFDAYFATANQNSSLFVYNTNRTSPVRVFTGHVSSTNCVAWSDNGFVLCSGSDDRTCRVWDFRQRSCARVLTGLQTAARCVAISPDGRLLASGTDSGMIYVYDMHTCVLIGVLQGHKNSVTSVSFSADTTALVSGGLDCAIRVWNLSQLIEQFSSSSAPVRPYETSIMQPSSSSSSGTTSNDNNTSQNLGKSSTSDESAASFKNRFQPKANFSDDANFNFFHMLPSNLNVLSSLHCFQTKLTPVHYVKYSPFNLVTAGGPFSIESDHTLE